MIVELDDQIVAWVQEVVRGDVAVTLDAPSDDLAGEGVSLALLGFDEQKPMRGPNRPPVAFRGRYLVTTWAEQTRRAHELLSQVLEAALDHEDTTIDYDPIALDQWSAFGCRPRPAFSLSLLATKARAIHPAKLVRTPLRVALTTTRVLRGVVQGPESIPLAGAVASIPTLNLTARADPRGRFRFDAVPADQSFELVVTAKGRTQKLALTPADGREPVRVQFELEE